jgi:hypothetical protein
MKSLSILMFVITFTYFLVSCNLQKGKSENSLRKSNNSTNVNDRVDTKSKTYRNNQGDIQFQTTSSSVNTNSGSNNQNSANNDQNSANTGNSVTNPQSVPIYTSKLPTNSTEEDTEPLFYIGNCFMKIHNYFFDLYPISQKGDIKIKTKEGDIVHFNLCKDVNLTSIPSATPSATCNSTGLLVQKEQCRLFADNEYHEKFWDLTSKFKYKIKNKNLKYILYYHYYINYQTYSLTDLPIIYLIHSY